MKKLFYFLLLFLYINPSFTQSLKKYPIGTSGCSIYCFCDPGVFQTDFSEDSSRVFTAECNTDGTFYGIICIKLKEPSSDVDAAENVLISYLDYLKTSFKITKSSGYGKGHRLRNREDTRGVIDYWTDTDKNNWKVKGWTNGKFITVLYAYSAKELSETKLDAFLNGLVFEGM